MAANWAAAGAALTQGQPPPNHHSDPALDEVCAAQVRTQHAKHHPALKKKGKP